MQSYKKTSVALVGVGLLAIIWAVASLLTKDVDEVKQPDLAVSVPNTEQVEPSKLQAIQLISDRLVLPKGSGLTAMLSVTGEIDGGGQADLSDATILYRSNQEEVATVESKSGLVTPVGAGAAVIEAEVTMDDVILKSSITIGVPDRLLNVDDFKLDGEYGSEGSYMTKVGDNHFDFHRGTNHFDATRANLPQFIVPESFKGNSLTVDIFGLAPPDPDSKHQHNYSTAYSLDNDQWTPVAFDYLEKNGASVARVFIEPSSSDTLYFGWSIPMSYEKSVELIEGWSSDPKTSSYVTVEKLGESYQGRDILKLIITDPHSEVPVEDRWVHYVSQEHPHEGKSRWRAKGLVDWLLSDDPKAADARQRSIWHVVMHLNPDGANHGFLRHAYGDYPHLSSNDVNRNYQSLGANEERQVKEIYLFQKDLEKLMASSTPITSYWDFHVWGNQVEPILRRGKEFIQGNPEFIGEFVTFKEMIIANDPYELIKPLALNGEGKMGDPTLDAGVNYQHGITAVLVEGGGTLDTQEENERSGAVLATSISQFYRDTKSTIEPWENND